MDMLIDLPDAATMDDVFAIDKEARQRAAGLIN
jgi:1-deoxy-D-xylulose-5-phosphate reductoisomerase